MLPVLSVVMQASVFFTQFSLFQQWSPSDRLTAVWLSGDKGDLTLGLQSPLGKDRVTDMYGVKHMCVNKKGYYLLSNFINIIII